MAKPCEDFWMHVTNQLGDIDWKTNKMAPVLVLLRDDEKVQMASFGRGKKSRNVLVKLLTELQQLRKKDSVVFPPGEKKIIEFFQ